MSEPYLRRLLAVGWSLLLVLSVVGVGTAFVGTAAATQSASGGGVEIAVDTQTQVDTNDATNVEAITAKTGSTVNLTFVINDSFNGRDLLSGGKFSYKLSFTDRLSLTSNSDLVEPTDDNLQSIIVRHRDKFGNNEDDVDVQSSPTLDENNNVFELIFKATDTKFRGDKFDVKFTITNVSVGTGGNPSITGEVPQDGAKAHFAGLSVADDLDVRVDTFETITVGVGGNQTIAAAVENASAGDEIAVPADRTEAVIIDKPDITLRSTGTRSTITAPADTKSTIRVRAANVTIRTSASATRSGQRSRSGRTRVMCRASRSEPRT